MTNSDNILTFGSFNAHDGVNTFLLSDIVLGVPARVREQLGGVGVDIAAAGALDESAWAVSRFVIEISDTTVDGVTARLAALAAELRDLATITIGLKGSAYTGTMTPKNAACVELPLTGNRLSALSNEHWAIVEVTVEREPWVYGATETLYSAAAVTIPAAIDLSAMTGDARTPLDVLLDATTANLHQVVGGVYPEVAALSEFVFEAADLIWVGDGDAAEADAAGYPDGVGNTLWKTNAAAGCYTDLDVTDFLGGTYALYSNAKRDAAASPATIETPYGAPVAIEGTDLRRQLVGLVSLPCAAVRGAATSTLRVTLKSDDTDYAYVNTLELVPLSWGAFCWHHGTAASSCDKLRLEDGTLYADDVASPLYGVVQDGLKALGGTLVVTGEGTAEAPTVAATATVTDTPRWEQLPTAGSGAGPGI